MGSDESHFNASLIVRDKVTRQRPQTKTFWGERRAEPSWGPSAHQPLGLELELEGGWLGTSGSSVHSDRQKSEAVDHRRQNNNYVKAVGTLQVQSN